MAENTLSCHNLVGGAIGTEWVEARDAAKYSGTHRTTHSNELPGPQSQQCQSGETELGPFCITLHLACCVPAICVFGFLEGIMLPLDTCPLHCCPCSVERSLSSVSAKVAIFPILPWKLHTLSHL